MLWYISGEERNKSPTQKASPALPSVVEGDLLQPGPPMSPIMSPLGGAQPEPETPVEGSSVSLPPAAEPPGEEEEVVVERVQAVTPAVSESVARDPVSTDHCWALGRGGS